MSAPRPSPPGPPEPGSELEILCSREGIPVAEVCAEQPLAEWGHWRVLDPRGVEHLAARHPDYPPQAPHLQCFLGALDERALAAWAAFNRANPRPLHPSLRFDGDAPPD